jgi:hypothetical protein
MSTEPGPARRPEAHRLLGVSDDAPAAAVEAAYWRLRAHIEARASDSTSAEFIDARRAELDVLEAALGHEPGATGDPRTTRVAPRWIVGLAVCATLLSIVLGALLYRQWASDRSTETEATPSLVTAHARPLGAVLQILSLPDEQLVMEGPADGTPIRVVPGQYRLNVSRPDCPDEWTREIALDAGDRRDFAPRICLGRGGLVVRSNVTGDRVQIDGLDVGTTSEAAHPLTVGDHQVTVQKSGHQLWSGRVRIQPNETLTLLAELEPEAGSAPQVAAAAPAAMQAAPPGQPPGGPTSGPEPDGRMETSGPIPDNASMDGAIRTGPGGSKSWHDAIRDKLVYSYDRNGSHSLDTPDEINAIPCEEWKSIESAYETGGLSVNMTRLYGFDGSKAPANTLGVTEAMRPYAYERMRSCGLKADL